MTKRSGGTGTREMRTGAGQRALSPGACSGGAALLVWALASAQGLCQDKEFVPALRVCVRTMGLCRDQGFVLTSQVCDGTEGFVLFLRVQ